MLVGSHWGGGLGTAAGDHRAGVPHSASIIEVNTAGMQVLAERMLQEVGRQDVTVALRPSRVWPHPPAQGG